MKTISILGTVGIPASYGGFETLAENLVRFHLENNLPGQLVVYCSAKSYIEKLQFFHGAILRYIRLNANGVASITYDIVSLLSAVRHRSNVILLLGVSGAIALPIVRFFSKALIVTNIDGIEWKRQKWKGLARWFLRLSERFAVKYSHVVIADNGGIATHVAETYGKHCYVIAYGGDHAVTATLKPYSGTPLPERYALALCRIEPENNVDMILSAFALHPTIPLVFVGNWNNSTYGQDLRLRYAEHANLYLLDPIYDVGILRTLRDNANIYVHGHSAGGTNPSLVEMMHFGVPILAYDCIFNRCTTEDKAGFFKDVESLRKAMEILDTGVAVQIGADMRRIAQDRYTWDAVGHSYFELLLGKKLEPKSVPKLYNH